MACSRCKALRERLAEAARKLAEKIANGRRN